MVQVLKGNIVQAPALGELQITEQGYLVMEDGVIRGVYDRLPLEYATAPLVDYGQALVMQSFADILNGCGDGMAATIQDGCRIQHALDVIIRSAEEEKWLPCD